MGRMWKIKRSGNFPVAGKAFASNDVASKWGREVWGAWEREYCSRYDRILGPISCICGYTGSQLNKAYRNNYNHTIQDDRRIWADVTIKELSERAPRVPCNIYAYRMVSKEEACIIVSGRRLQIMFISTSLSSQILKSEEYKSRPYMLEILVPKETIGAYVGDISGRKEECELLIYGVNYTLERQHYIKRMNGKWTIGCCIVPHKGVSDRDESALSDDST